VPATSVLVQRPLDWTPVRLVSFVMESKSEDGRAQPAGTDIYTVCLRCVQEEKCGDTEFSTTATYKAEGLYQFDVEMNQVGKFEYIVTMENEYTCSNCGAPTTIINGTGFFELYGQKIESFATGNHSHGHGHSHWGSTAA